MKNKKNYWDTCVEARYPGIRGYRKYIRRRWYRGSDDPYGKNTADPMDKYVHIQKQHKRIRKTIIGVRRKPA